MTEPMPLRPMPVTEVPLPHAPLAAVVAQVRFAPILAISQFRRPSDAVIAFQERLRPTYPHLSMDHTHHLIMAGPSPAHVDHSQVWRFSDSAGHLPAWRVSLTQDFVSLETRQYSSRSDFLARLQFIIEAMAICFSPTDSTRLGLRYIDRLAGVDADRVADFVKTDVLGLLGSADVALAQLQPSIVHSVTHAQFLAPAGDTVTAKWGLLPPNTTHDSSVIDPITETSWVLDMDMFSTRPHSFSGSDLVDTATNFAECLYWLFREMTTEDFLRHHGGVL